MTRGFRPAVLYWKNKTREIRAMKSGAVNQSASARQCCNGLFSMDISVSPVLLPRCDGIDGNVRLHQNANSAALSWLFAGSLRQGRGIEHMHGLISIIQNI